LSTQSIRIGALHHGGADEDLDAPGERAVARLAGLEVPKHEDTEQAIPELKARIGRTIVFIESVKQAQLDGTEEKEVVPKLRGQDGLPRTAVAAARQRYPSKGAPSSLHWRRA
jgi:hypothetical protein